MPPSLSQGARAVWRRTVGLMVKAGTVAEIHADTLALYCEVWSQFQASPGAATSSMIAQLRMLQGELGLTPATRARVPVLEPPEEKPAPLRDGKVVTIADLLRPTRERKAREAAQQAAKDADPKGAA